MKAYKFEIVVLDFEGHGLEEMEFHVLQNKYYTIQTLSTEEAEIGEWDDDHPMNKEGCDYSKYFTTMLDKDKLNKLADNYVNRFVTHILGYTNALSDEHIKKRAEKAEEAQKAFRDYVEKL